MAIRFDVQRKIVLVVLAVVAIAFAWILEATQEIREVPGYAVKKRAADLAADAYAALEDYYVSEIGPLTRDQVRRDPGRTCLIGTDEGGSSYTLLMNAGGSATAKQRAINPNFAAILVGYFQKLGLGPGDPVAVALSGSYPGMNVNLYAAMTAMELDPTVITSLAGSRYGATRADFTWLDMERVLAERGLMEIRSAAASPGGAQDRGETLSEEGLQAVWDAIERNGVQAIRPDDLDDSIDTRMRVYRKEAGDERYRAYVNLGGATPSLGISFTEARDLFDLSTGLHRNLWRAASEWPRHGTMMHMASEGTPVIHIGDTQSLAVHYGLSTRHRNLERIPEVGEGTVLRAAAYKPSVALILLAIYVLLLIVLVLPEIRQRIFGKPADMRVPVGTGD
ncbi:MAG: poly-gamma-glutamate system protein [Candidatus Eisenbacteria bacterium]|nr:poly-gamma-glutamate system protein [Candidatus Eisenbacteria bacterium]